MTQGSPFARDARRPTTGQDMLGNAMQAHASATDAPDCFVSLCDPADIKAQVHLVAKRMADGAELPLAGLTFCVKDNIDAAGLASTGNCPGYGRVAEAHAPVVQMALDAGAILIGKNTMDQFATGLNGTRSPDPICRNAIDPKIIPGGSSSGSAVAVARGICDFAFGSDTGGSGRVPAAANGIVGLKPTPGLISGRGMVYCNRSFDVIPIFARTVAEARHVLTVIGMPDPLDPFAFRGEVKGPGARDTAMFAIPERLDHFGDLAAANAHDANLKRLEATGAQLQTVDFAPFEEAGRLVFGSALVAERLIDYGDFIEANPAAVMPPVAQAINAGRSYSARDAFEVMHRIAELKLECNAALGAADALVLPTIPRLFTVSEMQAEPMQRNTIMGTYTYFANPLGYAAIAVPGDPRADGLPSSLCFVGHAGHDHLLADHAERFTTQQHGSQ